MPDKEFDALLKQRFEDFEPEPSAGLWDKIAEELDEKRPAKSTFPVFWLSAASIAVVLGFGMYLLNPKETIKLRGKTQADVARNATKPVADYAGTDVQFEADVQPKLASKPLAGKRSPLRKTIRPVYKTAEPPINKDLPPTPQISVAEAEHQKKVPVSDNKIVPANRDSTVVTAAILSSINHTEIDPPAAPGKKIKSIGGLVNYVIARVDHRDDKIIEFTDNDEGSEVSGINLGIIKIKNRNK